MTAIAEPSTKVYEPTEWQEKDLAQLVTLRRSANWSEMGCYKTTTIEWLIERLLLLGEELEAPKVLIVTTRSGKGTYFQTLPSVLKNWAIFNVLTKEIRLVLDGEEYKLEKDELPNEVLNHPTVILTHYNVFSKRKPKKIKGAGAQTLEALIERERAKNNPKVTLRDKLQRTNWDFIGLDEAHRIKGRETGWTKEIRKLRGRYKHIMTGTGFINDPSEVWGLLHWLDPQRFSSYTKFRQHFCEEDYDDNGYIRVVGPRAETVDEFRALLRSFGPRREKMEVFKDLKEPLRTTVEVELNDIQRTMYDSIKSELYTLDQNGEPFYAPNVLAALIRLRQISVATPEVVETYYDEETETRKQIIKLVEPSSKLDALMDIIEGLEWDQDRRDQIVVFSNFKDPIALAIKRFEEAGISYIHMTEKDNDRERYQKWAVDFPKKEAQVFICTLQLGGESITLTSASTCVFLDRSWSPKDNSQGEARIWRPGQREVANIININAEGTVDLVIEERVNRKQSWFNQIFGNERPKQ